MDLLTLVWFSLGAFVFLLLLDTLSTPLSVAARVMTNSVTGGLALLLANTTLGWAGLHLPVNPVSSVIAGMLGVPGVVALAVLRVVLV